MAKAKAPKATKPKKEKPVKAKKEKPVKAKKEKTPKQPKAVKPRVAKIKVKSDLYTVVLMLTFFALATACILIYLNNSWHATH
jgi:hypothetical protein